MEFGTGDHWVGVLVGGLFALILWPALLFLIWAYGRRLLAAVGVGQLKTGDRPGLIGLLRDSLVFLARAVFVGAFAVGCLWIALSGLTYYFPSVGTAHPVITSALRLMAKPERAQRALDRGLGRGDPALVELALAMGAQPDGDARSDSVLMRTRDPALRDILLRHGASPDGGRGQEAPLAAAAGSNDLDDWRWLLKLGARRGLAATLEQPQPLLHQLALAETDTVWLLAALEAGVDPNLSDSGGASLLDVLVLSGRASGWRGVLRQSGGRHRLPLDAPDLPIDHPAGRIARAWLATDRNQRDWASPLAAAGSASADELLLTETPVGRIQGDRTQVLAHFPLDRPTDVPPLSIVVRLVPHAVEAAAEAPAADAEDVTWRVAGLWLDERPRE